ncbi:tRNA (guanine-N(7)-)-methyltransferase [Bacteriovorax sp. BSW11_IV]|uniref:tRNA (guanosine(46)-N7)-methyltransferase TrmB n=1 Tax=Bacteriovorax sp. BSW11_IV TaxID=1353529 RepID=UPI00038A1619|nr:tRNA (guanosine(46)-N7)-methyltransferase TrmB [Bacteriovorax sp. BSW11_IV]EQC45950.1 tRNA (guanine-N(7)-)-methyltransferase [Bacteriovorax sp. BSW11_IV]
MVDKAFTDSFKYTHDNPYHDKLKEFEEFVLRDHEAETNVGQWNQAIFNREAPLCLEIGSGYGHFMMEYCEKNPDVNFIGLDYRFKRSYALAKKLSLHPNRNFKYLRAKGERISFMFEENELDRMFYFFPDPWPKARHNKKRLFQLPFLQAAYKVLRPGGTLYVKTDHEGYADWMEEVMNNQDLFDVQLATRDLRVTHPDHFLASFQTKFEKIFISQGVNIKAYVLVSKKKA